MRGTLLWAAALVVGCGAAMGGGTVVAGTGADAGPVGGPGAPSDAGAPPAPDAGPSAGSPDAGAPDGGTASACQGLAAPAIGTPRFVDLDVGDPSEVCALAAPDGAGLLALRVGTYDDSGIHRTTWSFVRGSDAARLAHVDYPAGTGPLTLLPQAQGFLGLDPGTSPLLHRIDGSGADVGSTATSTRSIVLDASGGVAGVSLESAPGAGSTLWLLRFDASGTQRVRAKAMAAADPAALAFQAVGVTTGGDAMVVAGPSQQGPCSAIWLDRDGAPASAVFQPQTCRIRQLHPLLDGGLALEALDRDGNPFIAGVLADRATALADAPDWLDDVRELFPLPGARGYALRRRGDASRLELLSPRGEACGEVSTEELDKGPLVVGRDGTLLEQDMGGAACTFRWYPGLFR